MPPHLKVNTIINVKNSAIFGHTIGNHLNVCVAEEAVTFTKIAVKLRCRKPTPSCTNCSLKQKQRPHSANYRVQSHTKKENAMKETPEVFHQEVNRKDVSL